MEQSMPGNIPSFRSLFHELEDYQGANAYEESLLPWLPQAQKAMDVIRPYGDAAAAHTWPKDGPDPCNGGDLRYYSCLERLYALSRVSDLLLVPFEPIRSELLGGTEFDQPWVPGAMVRAEQRLAWWQALGMTPIPETQPFHPFYHEIVSVEHADNPSEPIHVTQTLWSGFLLGQLLFARAGVAVRGGRDHIVKEIAETSRLYWTYWRNNRRAVDLSHGWGHNSQWNTDFRRDYVTDQGYHYNVDEQIDIDDESTGAPGEPNRTGDPHLTLPMRIELLTHRCFIRTPERFYNEDFDAVTYQEPK
jgi:hypothetical protein